MAKECAEQLRELLADGPRAVKEIEDELRANGFTTNAIRDARKVLKVRAVKDGFEGGWTWQLPNTDTEGGSDEDVAVPPGW